MTEKVAIVTGSNKGIGYAIVKGLCEKFPGVVYLTARDERRGQAAVAELKKLGFKPEFHLLDVTDKKSITALKDFIKKKHGGIDVLVNNAAIGFHHGAPEPLSVQAELTFAVNYTGLIDVCHQLFPLLRPHARVVNLSSSVGHLTRVPGEEIRKKFLNPNLTEQQLTQLMNSFIEDVKQGNHVEKGWNQHPYFMSKVFVSKLTFIQQAEFNKDSRADLVINAVHPGFVDTDMTNHKGTLTTEEGARAPLYAALLPPNVKEYRGAYVWRDCTITDWVAPLKEQF